MPDTAIGTSGRGPGIGAVDTMTATDIDRELAGLDALELGGQERKSLAARAWSAAWPKLIAIGLVLLVWELVAISGWKSDHILPDPSVVLKQFWSDVTDGTFFNSSILPATMRRALVGYASAVLIGTAIGAVLSQIKVLRTGVASLISGLQTMPSVLWYPMAIVLFQLGESAILFVVISGAAPSIVMGILSGSDQVPPLLLRAGRVLGAERFTLWREVVFPASLPSIIAGLKQGWAFSWRSLMAGELIGATTGKPGIGGFVDQSRTLSDYTRMYSTMIMILLIGICVDAIFNVVEKHVNRRRGLIDNALA
jgi:NitT/TauT family transport system permease protein